MGLPKVSSDAMPALTGRRCVGTVTEAAVCYGKQGGTAEMYFLSLFPCGNRDFFISLRSIYYVEEITGQTMVNLTSHPFIPKSTLFYKE